MELKIGNPIRISGIDPETLSEYMMEGKIIKDEGTHHIVNVKFCNGRGRQGFPNPIRADSRGLPVWSQRLTDLLAKNKPQDDLLSLLEGRL